MGAKTLAKAEIDFAHPRNLVITAVILILGTGIDQISITSTISISGLAIAGIMGVLFNLILPKEN